MVVIGLQLAYKGTSFSGFARQPGQLTVQGELEHAFFVLLRREVLCECAGRTDAGVHARGQVVSLEVSDDEYTQLNLESFKRSVNALTHDDIAVHKVWKADAGFSARFSARAREYRYFLSIDDTPAVLAQEYCWHTGSLDLEAMRDASHCLIGEHDFKSFCKAVSAQGKPTCRNIEEISLQEESLFGQSMLVICITGNAFLHSMVRTIVGSLVLIGRGKRPASWLKTALEACDRRAAGECGPPQGLVLWSVRYD